MPLVPLWHIAARMTRIDENQAEEAPSRRWRIFIAVALCALLVPIIANWRVLGDVDLNDPDGRSLRQQVAFRKANACPSNGQTTGECPGFVVVQIGASCLDPRAQLAWRSVVEARAIRQAVKADCERRAGITDENRDSAWTRFRFWIARMGV